LSFAVYRPMRPGEAHKVCELVRQVFNEFIAQEFGKEACRNSSASPTRARCKRGCDLAVFVLVASQFDKLSGVLEFAPDRIAMLFVLLPHRGIAKELLARAIDQIRTARPGLSKLTVHSSRYAEPIYRRMGVPPSRKLDDRERDYVHPHRTRYWRWARDSNRQGMKFPVSSSPARHSHRIDFFATIFSAPERN
jgi:hypothetical protein